MRPSATTIETSATSDRQQPRDDGAEDEQQDEERDRQPELSSPFCRSSSESVEKSRSAVNSPVIAVSKPSLSARVDDLDHLARRVLAVTAEARAGSVARPLGATRVGSDVE